MAVPVFTWTGAYFGINAGYSFDDTSKYRLTGVTAGDNGLGSTRPRAPTLRDDGFTGGGQIGYNYQFAGSGIVLGLEADADYVDTSQTATFVGISPAGIPAFSVFHSSLDFLGTVRGRVGYALDRFLVYGTGGFAYGQVTDRASLYTAGNPNQLRYFGARRDMETGYTYGGGVEYALPTTSFFNLLPSSAVTIKVEYLRYELGRSNFVADNILSNTASAYRIRAEHDGNIVRVGLNYKF